MRIALGTVVVNREMREAIGQYYGEEIASRETCRRYIIDNGYESIYDQLRTMELKDQMELDEKEEE